MGGRPAKPINLAKGHRTEAERAKRAKGENNLKGSRRLIAPKYLTDPQKKYFKFIVKELKDSEILSKIDEPILCQTARCLDRLETIEKRIDATMEKLDEVGLDENEVKVWQAQTNIQDKLMKQFFRCCSELGMSAQSRAKLAINMPDKEEKQSIMDILADDE